MNFSDALRLGPGGSVASFRAALQQHGGTLSAGEPDPNSGMVPLRSSGEALSEFGFQRVIVLAHSERIVRVLAVTDPWDAGELQRRFGDPRQQDPQTGFHLWVFETPRWSIEARPGPDEGVWTLEVKFLSDAVEAGMLSPAALDRMYAGLNTA